MSKLENSETLPARWGLAKLTIHSVHKCPLWDFLQTSWELAWGSDFTDLMTHNSLQHRCNIVELIINV